jgi:Cutinase
MRYSILLAPAMAVMALAAPQPQLGKAGSEVPFVPVGKPSINKGVIGLSPSEIFGAESSSAGNKGSLRTPVTQSGLETFTGSDFKGTIVIFARGTLQSGNVGEDPGPNFMQALQTTLGAGEVLLQGVTNYPATLPGFQSGGDAGGSREFANMVSQAAKKFPQAKIVMSGFRYVNNCAINLSPSVS